MNLILRKMASKASPVMEIRVTDEERPIPVLHHYYITGVNLILRKMASKASPVMEIRVTDEERPIPVLHHYYITGVNLILRKMASKASPVMEIRVTDEEKIKIVMKMGFMTQEDCFFFDEEFLKEVQGTVMKVSLLLCLVCLRLDYLTVNSSIIGKTFRPNISSRPIWSFVINSTLF